MLPAQARFRSGDAATLATTARAHPARPGAMLVGSLLALLVVLPCLGQERASQPPPALEAAAASAPPATSEGSSAPASRRRIMTITGAGLALAGGVATVGSLLWYQSYRGEMPSARFRTAQVVNALGWGGILTGIGLSVTAQLGVFDPGSTSAAAKSTAPMLELDLQLRLEGVQLSGRF